MNKMRMILVVLVSAGLIWSCGSGTSKKADIMEAVEAGVMPKGAEALALNLERSKVEWEGSKVVGKHNGTIDIAEGELFVYEGDLVGGRIVIDMNTIVVLDLTDPDVNAMLKGHLDSDDFFSVASFPKAYFDIARFEPISDALPGAANYTVTANLTIKGITHGIAFPFHVHKHGSSIHATADFNIDRTRWEIRYGSGRFFENLGDNMISDNFNIKFDVMTVY
jgi:polyisoprenoid-binding protein YceI